MNKTSENPEFVKTIEDIRGAEQQYEEILSEARAKADRILREAKEKVHEEREKTQEDIVKLKNEKIRGGSKEIEGNVEGMIKKARDEAGKTNKKKLEKKDVSKLVKEFLDSL